MKIEEKDGNKIFFDPSGKRFEDPNTFLPLNEKQVAETIALRWFEKDEAQPPNGGQYKPTGTEGGQQGTESKYKPKTKEELSKILGDYNILLKDRQDALKFFESTQK